MILSSLLSNFICESGMAELQWIIEVRCINALLAEVKVGEKGEYVMVNIPNRNFYPSELERLIKAFEIAEKINKENRLTFDLPIVVGEFSELEDYVEIVEKRDLARIGILSNGEIVNIDVPEWTFSPSEAHGFMIELKKVQQTMTKLRSNKP
jgi:hypothetical protein